MGPRRRSTAGRQVTPAERDEVRRRVVCARIRFIRARGALPSMSRLRHGATPTVRAWLGRIVEKLRGGAVDSDAAKDRDAAKWRRVEPMIERLRETAKVARHDYATEDDATVGFRVTGHELIDAVTNLLAAAKEPS